jgi:hypothetical protein
MNFPLEKYSAHVNNRSVPTGVFYSLPSGNHYSHHRNRYSLPPELLFTSSGIRRAVDSAGQSIDFLLPAKRNASAAKRFFQKVFSLAANLVPRVINVDKNPAYPAAIRVLKLDGTLPQTVRLHLCKHLTNVIEQDHRLVKKRTWLAKGYNTFQSAWRTLEGIKTVNMIRKGRVRWVAKDVPAEARFIARLFGIAS